MPESANPVEWQPGGPMGFLLRSVLPPIVVKQSRALITIDRITSKSKKKAVYWKASARDGRENGSTINKSNEALHRGGRGHCIVRLHRSAYTMAARKRREQTIFRPAASGKKYEKKIIKNSENSWKSRKSPQKGCGSSQGKFGVNETNGHSADAFKYRGYLNEERWGWVGGKKFLLISPPLRSKEKSSEAFSSWKPVKKFSQCR